MDRREGKSEMAGSSLHGSLSAEEARRILGFLGYGRLSAPVWFIGLEEGLGKQDSVDWARNLRERGTWDEVMDLDRAHLLLHEGGAPMRISIKPPRTPTWRWMAKICRALAGNSGWSDSQAAEEYVKRRLGRTDPAIGETFLTELSPIPSKKVAENREWLRLFRRAGPDCDHLIWQRSVRLRAMIEENRPKFVFCYGSENPENNAKFKSFFSERSWQRVGEKSELSRHEDSVRVLMPFFGNGRVSFAECQRVITAILK
jgi:hypothetical protein